MALPHRDSGVLGFRTGRGQMSRVSAAQLVVTVTGAGTSHVVTSHATQEGPSYTTYTFNVSLRHL